MDDDKLPALIARYKADPESVYNTWFIDSPARLKAFRSIRRGVGEVVAAIRAGTFGNDFKGSLLETVLDGITEQKQVFEGAAHAFYWKPKLRIPDIYENEENKRAFAGLLDAFLGSMADDRLTGELLAVERRRIKGLGPAVANILYFLHPTRWPPSNTAMLRGFNALFGAKKKLGSWTDYLEMRETILAANAALQPSLSKDLGAFSGLLFEIGSGKLATGASSELAVERARAEMVVRQRHEQVLLERKEEDAHLKMQFLLTRIGRALGYRVHVATNDRGRVYEGEALASLSCEMLPEMGFAAEVAQTIALIDVVWLHAAEPRFVAAFEVEKSTSIYSGMLRLMDLEGSLEGQGVDLYLVVPDAREREVLAQMKRPAFARPGRPEFRYIVFSELCDHCASVCKLGTDHRVMLKIARGASC